MSYYDYKHQYDALTDRDKKIWDLHRKSTNALGFALQNSHSENIQIKYENQSELASNELWKMLTEIDPTLEEVDLRGRDRDEWKHEAAEQKRLK